LACPFAKATPADKRMATTKTQQMIVETIQRFDLINPTDM